MNGWSYVESNPIVRTDPSGMISQVNAATADKIVRNLSSSYDINIKKDWGHYTTYSTQLAWPPILTCTAWDPGRWTVIELQTVEAGVTELASAMGGSAKFKNFIGGLKIILTDSTCGRGCTSWNKIEFLDRGKPPTSINISNGDNIDKWTVVHELGHAWDGNNWGNLSKGLEKFTGGSTSWFGGYPSGCDVHNRLPGCNNAGYFYSGPPPAGSDAGFNRKEDFAESVAAYVYPIAAQSRVVGYKGDPVYGNLYYSNYTGTKRWDYINGLITGTITP
jgi:hypothetical protein